MKVQQRIQTINQQPGEAPLAAIIQLVSTDMTEMELEAWVSGGGNTSVYIFEEELTLAQCEAIVHETVNPVNCMMVVASGKVHCPMRNDVKVITVYFEGKNEGTITKACCVKTIEAPTLA
jgi:hypothetical protein